MELKKKHLIIALIIVLLGLVAAAANVFTTVDYNQNSITNVSNITTGKVIFETSPNNYIEDNSTCMKLHSSTVDFVIC